MDSRKRELAKIRQQRNIALKALLEIAQHRNIYLPPGFFTEQSAIEISKEEFFEDLQNMLAGRHLCPIAVIGDEQYADLSIFWLREVSEFGSQLRVQESNFKGFVDSQEQIRSAIDKRSNCKFIRLRFVPSFAEDLKQAILNAG